MKPTKEKNWELPLSQIITYRLARVHSKVTAQATRILKENSELSLIQWRVLVSTHDSENITHSKLVAKTGLDGGQLSRCIRTMLEKGLLEAKTHESDSRQQHLSMTPKGIRAYKEALPFMRNRQAHFVAALTADEREALFSILEKLEMVTEVEDFTG